MGATMSGEEPPPQGQGGVSSQPQPQGGISSQPHAQPHAQLAGGAGAGGCVPPLRETGGCVAPLPMQMAGYHPSAMGAVQMAAVGW